MSATLAAEPVARFLDGCPVVDVPGRPHPLEIAYAPGESVADAVRAVVARLARQRAVLPARRARDPPRPRRGRARRCPTPRWSSARRARRRRAGSRRPRQRSPAGRRVILATNIAETSLTVPGVDTVVDTGLHKVARYDATRALDTLDTERISQASADQRAGRAARLGPGRARRLWDARDRLRPHGEPDIARIDLAGPLLDLAAWGADPATFAWFEAPPADAVAAARALLQRLGALDGATLTPLGRRMQALPLPPRLARILIEAGGAREAARACAMLSERHLAPARREATTCDLLGSLDAWASLPPHVHQVARQIEDLAAGLASADSRASRTPARRSSGAPLAGPSPRPTCGGRSSSATPIAWRGGASRRGRRWCWRPGPAPCSAARAASATASSWSRSTSRRPTRAAIRWTRSARPRRQPGRAGVDRPDRDRRRARLRRADRARPRLAARALRSPGARRARAGARAGGGGRSALADAWLAGEPDETNAAWLRRVRFAGLAVDLPALVRAAAHGRASLADLDLARARAASPMTRELDRLAPTHLDLPSGRRTRARLRGGRHASRRRPSCRSCSGWPRRRASAPPARRSCCRCWRPTAGRCRRRAICAASGIARIPRCARSCAAAIRGIPGPRIPGRRRRRREPGRGRAPRRTAGVVASRIAVHDARALQTPAGPID